MPILIYLILLCPLVLFANDNEIDSEFIIDNRRVNERNVGDTGTLGLTHGYEPEVAPEPVATEGTYERIGDDGANLEETGGFDVTQEGGIESTNRGESQGRQLEILGLALGGSLAAICPSPTGSWACPLAAMAFQDALSGGSAQAAAIDTRRYIDPTPGDTSGGGDTPGTIGGGGDTPGILAAQEGLNSLAQLGYTVNSDGSVSTPDGQIFTAKDYDSADSLIKKGLSPEVAQTAIDGLAEARTEAAEKAGVDPDENQGQAIASTSKAGTGISAGDANPRGGSLIEEIEIRGGKKKKKKKNGRLPASQAARLSKDFHGQPIGIGMANLFLIVHQKYIEKNKKPNEFINREY